MASIKEFRALCAIVDAQSKQIATLVDTIDTLKNDMDTLRQNVATFPDAIHDSLRATAQSTVAASKPQMLEFIQAAVAAEVRRRPSSTQ